MLGMNKVGNQKVYHPPYKHHKITPPAPFSRLLQTHDENTLVHGLCNSPCDRLSFLGGIGGWISSNSW